MKDTKNPSQIHLGMQIQKELNRRNQSVTWLAEQLGIKRPNCYRIIHAESMNTERLYLISRILHHDFFIYYSQVLQDEQRD